MSNNNLTGGGQDLLLLRRRMMMRLNSCPYITNGLAFWLDGINKGDSSDWKDLVGGIVFTNHGAMREDNGWRVSYNPKTYLSSSDTRLSFPINSSTIEVCVKGDSGRWQIIYMPRNVEEIALGYRDEGIIYATGSALNIYEIPTSLRSGVFSVSSKHCVCNKIERTLTTREDYWGNTNGTAYINGRGSGSDYPFNGIVHSIRIYNRQLTIEEMLHNQQVDNDRFNLGLTF